MQIAEILPREKQGILACFSYEPVLVKQNLQAIHKLIKRARETPIKQLDEQERTLATIDTRQQETAVEGKRAGRLNSVKEVKYILRVNMNVSRNSLW